MGGARGRCRCDIDGDLRLAAARAYFGASTVVWANVIGLVLAALSIGYWLGGRIADRHPQPHVLGGIVVAAGALIAVIPFAAQPLLDLTVTAEQGLGGSRGRLVHRLARALRAARRPARDGGAVRDPARRLRCRPAGTVAGRLYALSTVGSIVGVVRAGDRHDRALRDAAHARRRRPSSSRSAAPCCCGVAGSSRRSRSRPCSRAGGDREACARGSCTRRTRSTSSSRSCRRARCATSTSTRGSPCTRSGGPTRCSPATSGTCSSPCRRCSAARVRSVAILGNAGGTTARAYGVFYPSARIDGVELDPTVTAAARRYMGLGRSGACT